MKRPFFFLSARRRKFSPEFWTYLKQHPEARVAAILRIEALEPEFEQQAEAAGCHITRRLHLLPALAVEGQADALLKLAKAAWIKRIESDQPVHSL